LAKFLKITVVMVSHDPTDGLSLADHMIILKDGKVIKEGIPKAIYNQPEYSYVAQLLGKANILKDLIVFPDSYKNYAVYPHDVSISNTATNLKAKVKSVHFNGFCNEVEFIINQSIVISYDFEFKPLDKG